MGARLWVRPSYPGVSWPEESVVPFRPPGQALKAPSLPGGSVSAAARRKLKFELISEATGHFAGNVARHPVDPGKPLD